jgi:hypothetical protein
MSDMFTVLPNSKNTRLVHVICVLWQTRSSGRFGNIASFNSAHVGAVSSAFFSEYCSKSQNVRLWAGLKCLWYFKGWVNLVLVFLNWIWYFRFHVGLLQTQELLPLYGTDIIVLATYSMLVSKPTSSPASALSCKCIRLLHPILKCIRQTTSRFWSVSIDKDVVGQIFAVFVSYRGFQCL